MAILGTEITGVWIDEISSVSFTDKDKLRIASPKGVLKEAALDKLNELPVELGEAIKANCVLTGGATASVAHWEKPNDFDFYCKRKIMVLKLKSLLDKYSTFVKDVDDKYIDKFVDGKCITANAVTLTNGVQIIIKGAFEEMHDNFDFIHCQPYYDFVEDKFWISAKQYYAIMHKKLVKNPKGVCEQERIQKFKDRGWTTV